MSSDDFSMLMHRIDELQAAIKRIEAKMSSGGAGGDVATDRDLDGPHGDQVVRKDPKRWPTENGSFVGCKWSECPPDYLDVLAGFREWQAQQDDKKGDDDSKRKASFARLDAKRMRGWAQRKRNGWRAPVNSTGGDFPPTSDDDVPF